VRARARVRVCERVIVQVFSGSARGIPGALCHWQGNPVVAEPKERELHSRHRTPIEVLVVGASLRHLGCGHNFESTVRQSSFVDDRTILNFIASMLWPTCAQNTCNLRRAKNWQKWSGYTPASACQVVLDPSTGCTFRGSDARRASACNFRGKAARPHSYSL
jgi:hypothetical protein